MKQRRQYDLVILGADAAGLAAAACAARRRADIALRVAVVRTGDEPGPGASSPGVPDFVWRRLDLHETGLHARPVSALISIFGDGRMLATHRSDRRTEKSLADADEEAGRLWADFRADAARAFAEDEALMRRDAKGAGKASGALAALLAGGDGPARARRMTESCAGLLDDYFTSEDVKTHLASAALMPLGLGGDEAGSAAALAAAGEPAAWRVRVGGRAPGLVKVLEDACKAAGADIIDAGVRAIEAADDKTRLVLLDDGEALRAPVVMASRAASPLAARLGAAPAFSPLARREGAAAEVRVKLAHPPEPPGGDANAIYFAAGSRAGLAAARDAALDGRLPEDPPLYFEFAKDEIFVRAPYCPAVLYTEDEPRGWTEQDRQALGRQVVARLGAVLNGAVRDVRRVEVKVAAREPGGPAESDAALIAPPAGHDEIGAAARFAMEIVGGE